MHDILRERLIRKIETLPEDQVYQTLDYIEFLEGKYGAEDGQEASGLRRFAEVVAVTVVTVAPAGTPVVVTVNTSPGSKSPPTRSTSKASPIKSVVGPTSVTHSGARFTTLSVCNSDRGGYSPAAISFDPPFRARARR